MSLTYRPVRAEELESVERLVVHSINDLSERHGFGPMANARPPQFQTYSLRDDPDGFWVAEEAGQVVGFAFSWICGSFWFLSELFISPTHQGRGIGNELMRRTLQHAAKAKCMNRALITFTFNTVSQALYIRHGLVPRLPMYFMKATREKTPALRRVELDAVPLEASHLRALVDIDGQSLGIPREKHHKFLINDKGTRGFLLCAAGDRVGYAYISSDGHIGPLAVTRPDYAGPAFRAAMTFALESGSPQLTAFLPGTSDALRVAIEHGMRVTFPMVLMSTHEFGNWNQYLARNPGFM
jgi:ribosomal protein S18 acetylase RimI-like enzyme